MVQRTPGREVNANMAPNDVSETITNVRVSSLPPDISDASRAPTIVTLAKVDSDGV
jgi:hypothetical protein